ncbi:MAG: hypothetical protein GDA36_07745 [Rhodobacteraceae bacterium]|nr:hypothetical protein [Paracoccaceae bacterium]
MAAWSPDAMAFGDCYACHDVGGRDVGDETVPAVVLGFDTQRDSGDAT